MNSEAQKLIELFDLQQHPEGGFFRETYRSKGRIPNDSLDSEFKGDRHFSTAIYFLLTSEHFSAFHKINQDEIWHFYKGSCLHLHVISKEGNYALIKIGNEVEEGQVPQFVVNAGDWFAAEIPEENSYAFVGCTVAPGFDFRDFEMPEKKELNLLYPAHQSIIERLGYAPI